MTSRRNLLQLLMLGGAGTALGTLPAFARTFAVQHTEAQWRQMLSPEAFHVLREQGTEAPYTSPLLNEHRRGTFTCAGCALALFSSTTKFDSGTGWPSFWAPLVDAVETTTDNSWIDSRIEVHCRRCGGHLGHVFDDGPRPTGLRYCMDGVALGFKPA
ncbi:MAG TPA: peptide-methionine (R)-S-oxide reductase MsrB [Rhizomicrobium sp.]